MPDPSHEQIIEETADRLARSYEDAIIHLADAADHIARMYQGGTIVKDYNHDPVAAFHPNHEVSRKALNLIDRILDTFLHEVRTMIEDLLAEHGTTFEQVIQDPESHGRPEAPGGLEVMAILWADHSEMCADPENHRDHDYTQAVKKAARDRYIENLMYTQSEVKRKIAEMN